MRKIDTGARLTLEAVQQLQKDPSFERILRRKNS